MIDPLHHKRIKQAAIELLGGFSVLSANFELAQKEGTPIEYSSFLDSLGISPSLAERLIAFKGDPHTDICISEFNRLWRLVIG